MHVDLAEFQIEISRIPDLLSLVRSKHDLEIQKLKPHSTLKHRQRTWARLKTRVEGRAKRFGTISGSSFLVGLMTENLNRSSEADVKEAMIQILLDHNWQLDDRELNEPSRKAWARIEPETKKIHNVNSEEN